MTRKEVAKIVHDFPIKEEIGFTSIEQTFLLMKYFEGINLERYYNAMLGNTCALIDNQTRTYHCDIITAIMCGLEDRDVLPHEWD